jgi:hypothetical protein
MAGRSIMGTPSGEMRLWDGAVLRGSLDRVELAPQDDGAMMRHA